MKDQLINLIDSFLEKNVAPIAIFAIWLGGIFFGVILLISPFLEGEHWWELFFLWPIGIVLLLCAIGIPLVFASGSFKDTIEKNKDIP